MRVWGPVLSCLKVIGTANIFSPFSFLKPPPPPPAPSLLLYLTPFVALFHSLVFSLGGKTGIMQEVMGCGRGRKEIRMLLDSHPVLLRSGAKQFRRQRRYTPQQAGSGAAEQVARRMWAVLRLPPCTLKQYLAYESTGLCWEPNQACRRPLFIMFLTANWGL